MTTKKRFRIENFSMKHFNDTQKLLFDVFDTIYPGAQNSNIRDSFKNIYDESRFDKMEQQENGIYYIYLDEDKVVGLIFGWYYAGQGSIHWVGLRNQYRHKGHGERIVRHMVNELRHKGAYKIEMFTPTSNRPRMALFKRLGFNEKMRLEKDKFGYNLTYMVKKLRKPREAEATKKIRFIGTGGQGIKLLSTILAKILSSLGYFVSLNLDYDTAVRGGNISADLIFSEYPVKNPIIEKADIMVDLREELSDEDFNTKTLIVDHDAIPKKITYSTKNILLTKIPIVNIAHTQFGSPIYVNMVALGAVLRHIGVNIEHLRLEKQLPPKFLETNIQAIKYGFCYRQ